MGVTAVVQQKELGAQGPETEVLLPTCCVTLAESLSISGPGLTQLHSHSESVKIF